MKHKKFKHSRRKATPEQVNAMNRELELRHEDFRFLIERDGRLVREKITNQYDDLYV
jgi:hypothetical protein